MTIRDRFQIARFARIGVLCIAAGILSAGWIGLAAAQDTAAAEDATTNNRPPAAAPAAPEPSRLLRPSVVKRPAWSDLNAGQRAALQPLERAWPSLSETQRLKWVEISRSFHSLPPAEQVRIQERMAEWVGLTRQQREQARLNFASTSSVPPDEKKAQWEAYRALSEEQRKKLAIGSPPAPASAAAVKPVAPQRLAKLPPPAPPTVERPGPRIGVPTALVHHNTLLAKPRPAASVGAPTSPAPQP